MTCTHCGEDTTPGRRYCSNRCRQAAYRARSFPGPVAEQTWRHDQCLQCDAPIEQPATGRPRVFCSDVCRQASHHGRRSWRRPAAPVAPIASGRAAPATTTVDADPVAATTTVDADPVAATTSAGPNPIAATGRWVVRTDADLGAASPMWNDGTTFPSRDAARAAVRAALGKMPHAFKAVQQA